MKRNNLCIRMHLGLGDTIICAPIVREKAKHYELVCVLAKHHNVPSTNYLFRDIKNVVVRGVVDDEEADMFVKQVWKSEVLRLGMFNHPFDGQNWDVEFYRHAGVEFGDRWNLWSCQRDDDAENQVVFRSGMLGGPFVKTFLHQDRARGFAIPREYPFQGLIYEPTPITPILFHWRKVIEACDEIHCIASSFAAFIDSIELPKQPKQPKLYLHAYCRPGEPLMKVNKAWKILT
jgi:hypothetical protein